MEDSGSGPNVRHYTGVCLNGLLSTAEILSGYSVSGLTFGTISYRIRNRIIIAPMRHALRTSCKADRPIILGRYEILEENDMKYCCHSLQFS